MLYYAVIETLSDQRGRIVSRHRHYNAAKGKMEQLREKTQDPLRWNITQVWRHEGVGQVVRGHYLAPRGV